jgi:hypothetical protein
MDDHPELFPEFIRPPEPEPPRPQDFVWPSDNPMEIPCLRVDMQALSVVEPSACWGSVSRRDTRNVSTWHFYADDYRFEQLWKTPEDVLITNPVNCVEPNFSSLDSMPYAVGLYQIYRKRWIARWWQEQGIRIFADLYVGEKYQKLNYAGLPKGWRAFATRGSAEHPQNAIDSYHQAREWAGGDIIFFCYSGGKPQAMALRAAGLPVILADHFRDENISTWLTMQNG